MPKFPLQNVNVKQNKQNKLESLDFDPRITIIKEDDLNANYLKNTNTFEIGKGWLNIPIEIIHGTLYTQLKGSITYQQIVSIDLDILPMHRDNKNGKFSEWRDARLPAAPLNKKIKKLINDNIEIRTLISENTDARHELEEVFNVKLFELEKAFGIVQTMLAEADDISLEHDLEIEALKTDIHNKILISFNDQIDIFSKEIREFIDSINTDIDSSMTAIIDSKTSEYNKAFYDLSTQLIKLMDESKDNFSTMQHIVSKNKKDILSFISTQQQVLESNNDILLNTLDTELKSTKDQLEQEFKKFNDDKESELLKYEQEMKSFRTAIDSRLKHIDSLFKTHAVSFEAKLLKTLDERIKEIGFDDTYVSSDTFDTMAEKLEQSLMLKFKDLNVNNVQSIEDQMVVIRRTIRNEIQINYNEVQETFASIDERSEFKLKQLNNEIISLRNELRDVKNKDANKNMSQFIINIEKRLKKLEQK